MPVANGVLKNCQVCNKEFYVVKSRIDSAIFCGLECSHVNRGVNKRKCLAGEPIFCKKHGLHTNWRYKKSNDGTKCNLCSNEQSFKYYKDPKKKIKRLLNFARHRAKKYNREFDLDQEYIKELVDKQNNRCSMSGIEFIDNDNNLEMSIDRINSDLGYIKGNVQLVLIVVNRMKMHHSMDFIIKLCTSICEHNKNAK